MLKSPLHRVGATVPTKAWDRNEANWMTVI